MPSILSSAFNPRKIASAIVACCAVAACGSAPALTIIPTFDSTITSDQNHAAIENTINNAISVYEQDFSNSIKVPIYFSELSGTTTLGESMDAHTTISYSAFRSALAAEPTSAVRATALQYLPNQANEPVPNTTGTGLWMAAANVNALVASGNLPSSDVQSPQYDGTISLNTSQTFTGAGSVGPQGNYSLETVVMHEIDEVLGLGSALPNYTTGSSPMPEDLYRYAANSARSFSTSATGPIYFSLNGTTDLAQFNNANNGGDYGDWASNPLPTGASPEVQDAFITGGQNITLGSNEFAALQAIGYVRVPDAYPLALLALGSGAAMLLVRKRRINTR
jgi:hypothetical protein